MLSLKHGLFKNFQLEIAFRGCFNTLVAKQKVIYSITCAKIRRKKNVNWNIYHF